VLAVAVVELTELLEQILQLLVDWVVAEELKLPEVQEAQEERTLPQTVWLALQIQVALEE
jgi:hypothetical protein